MNEENKQFIPVEIRYDDDAHSYIIPTDQVGDFELLLSHGEKAEDEFIERFSQYMTDGDLNNKRLFIEAPNKIAQDVFESGCIGPDVPGHSTDDDYKSGPDIDIHGIAGPAPIPKRFPKTLSELEMNPDIVKRTHLLKITEPKRLGALEMVEEFHQAFDCPVFKTPVTPTRRRRELREELMDEELDELISAMENLDTVKILDGLCDLLYVVYGTAHEYGLGPILKEAFAEVHRSNMSKLGADGKPIYRADGKIMKGPNFAPPDLASILVNPYADKLQENILPLLRKGISASIGENMPHIEGMPEPKNTGVIYSDLKKAAPDNYERQVTNEQPPADGNY